MAWDDDVTYCPDPPEHPEDRTVTHLSQCPYGHDDRTALGYCQAECARMIAGQEAQLARAEVRGDDERAYYLRRALSQWRRRLVAAREV